MTRFVQGAYHHQTALVALMIANKGTLRHPRGEVLAHHLRMQCLPVCLALGRALLPG
jgi:hypothetical protein